MLVISEIEELKLNSFHCINTPMRANNKHLNVEPADFFLSVDWSQHDLDDIDNLDGNMVYFRVMMTSPNNINDNFVLGQFGHFWHVHY